MQKQKNYHGNCFSFDHFCITLCSSFDILFRCGGRRFTIKFRPFGLDVATTMTSSRKVFLLVKIMSKDNMERAQIAHDQRIAKLKRNPPAKYTWKDLKLLDRLLEVDDFLKGKIIETNRRYHERRLKHFMKRCAERLGFSPSLAECMQTEARLRNGAGIYVHGQAKSERNREVRFIKFREVSCYLVYNRKTGYLVTMLPKHWTIHENYGEEE